MIFTTFAFVLFLAVIFTAYWSFTSFKVQNGLLVLASFLFYGWWDVRFCGLMFWAAGLDFLVGVGLEKSTNPRARRALLCVTLCANLGLLGFFKYYNFFIENLQAALATIGSPISPSTLYVVLPVGISFYTFQTMSYTIEVYRRRMHATTSAIDYFAFVTFFPQLVAGPIERAYRLLPQFETTRRFDPAMATDGCRQMLWGFFKKMAIADNLAIAVDTCYRNPGAHSGPQMAFATICFAFQIYCDFSAYSDIATGTGKLFGIQLMRNFAYPYFSQTIGEFWRRWHISLSTWFRDYVFIPLGGSRTTAARTAQNILATFTLSGIWHGASWNFLIWGAINGLGVLPTALRKSHVIIRAHDTPGGESLIPSPVTLFRMLRTFLIICLGWVFFRAATIHDALSILRGFVVDAAHPSAYHLPVTGSVKGLAALAMLILAEWVQRRRVYPLDVPNWPRAARWLAYTALFWATLYITPGTRSPFIYFQF
ncbi:MAG: MBOAT family protein [Planctomycetia bacterium]|nr:MBOAT family protein [Planctomycetia bacterium]